MGDRELENKVAVVTGASRGIGRELALRLAGEGSRLALAARGDEALEETAAECRRHGAEVLAVPTDVGNSSECRALIEKTVEVYGRIDVLFNNAGIVLRSRYAELPDLAALENVMRINFFGAAACSYYALPYLRETRGRLVAINSMGGKWGVKRYAAYAASKHALAGLFDSIRPELKEDGVSVTVVYPSFVATGGRAPKLGLMARIMSVERCADLILRATRRRQRELVMTIQGKAGLWLKLVAPGFLDRITEHAMESVPQQ